MQLGKTVAEPTVCFTGIHNASIYYDLERQLPGLF
jgi:hypothetical protein